MTKTEAIEALNSSCMRLFGCDMTEATDKQAYKALCTVIRNELYDHRRAFKRGYREQGRKQVFYMSMEFLVGTSLHNNLFNMGLEETFTEALKDLNIDIRKLYALDPDAGLGNGGLGRLASCYLDSLTGLGYPATGYSIRYEFGIFKQQIVDGWQMELPDDWLQMGEVWLVPKMDDAVEVRFGGQVQEWYDGGKFKVAQHGYTTVLAVPYNLYISGYDSKAVNKLVLWSARSPRSIDMEALRRGEFARAMDSEKKANAEIISSVLYPEDKERNGKILRLKQQYLLCSASLQTILRNHIKRYGSLRTLPDKVAIHINDTHPALCVPELMRLLMDEHDYDWDEAWDIASRTLSYTNHTVMSEALECWDENLFRELLPRIYAICAEINRRLLDKLRAFYGDDQGKLDWMAVISKGKVRMHNLCLATCHKINGVSALHTEILKQTIFHDYYRYTPDRFLNVTNGIAYRRWLCQSNPELTALLRELIGDGFLKDANALEDLLRYADDKTVLDRLAAIKRDNKARLAKYIAQANGVNVDPDSLFDVQVKRLHEYKRQMLNVLNILYRYNQIKDNPSAPWQPKTYIFGAKASAGYDLAKAIIALIVAVSNMVNSDPDVRDKLKVIFVEDYRVSLAEIIIPAAEISEQISIAGKEASGTGNMKFMINGAVTIGTLDGANVEIHDQVGDENMFLFGMRANEVQELWRRGYDPRAYITPDLQRVLGMLTSGVLGQRFDVIIDSLTTHRFGVADAYMTLADFNDYARAQRDVDRAYADRDRFNRMSLVNIAKAGIFSADRSVQEYARNIWNL